MQKFNLKSTFKPTGDQPEAIEKLTNSITDNRRHQTLLGVTGSGKTFTMANVIKNVQKPTLVMAHNKTLAAQLCSEFKEFFPDNAVEYFVSYYDHYQPEAYVIKSDTFIEKDASINDEIDKLRHSATSALLERRDTIVVASVSCIYGLGDPNEYKKLMVSLRAGMEMDRDDVIRKLVAIQYERNDINFVRGAFRVRGDVLEIFPASSSQNAIRVDFFGDEIEKIIEVNALTGEIVGIRSHISIFPASHYATTEDKIERAIVGIEEELEGRIKYFKDNKAQRIQQRTMYDIEMLREVGFCQGIENYSRHIVGREAGTRPYTLLDYFPDDYLIMIDESHVSVPQIRGMFNGDQARKKSLIDFGFRLPSAFDNRPLNFSEFERLVKQVVFVSATPGEYELDHTKEVVEQIIRPTWVLDPIVDVRPVDGQIDDLVSEINKRIAKKERVLVTTLTKKMSEDLTKYIEELDIKVRYLHSDIKTLERLEIIRDLRLGVFDVLIGINLLREGLDLPEVSLVVILDADKEGFLRSETALVQTIGRAARHQQGRVILYADKITKSMKRAMDETKRRRKIQEDYNTEHKLEPVSINKKVYDVIQATKVAEDDVKYSLKKRIEEYSLEDTENLIRRLEVEMLEAAEKLQFERAAQLRDKIHEIRK